MSDCCESGNEASASIIWGRKEEGRGCLNC
jgi:hypothetical protein